MLILYVLICVASLALRSPVLLNIYNRYQDINLISPVYFVHGKRWNVAPGQEVDIFHVDQNRLEFDSGQEIQEGVLVYTIQRKHAGSDEFIQDESKNIQLLVAWQVDHTKGLDARALLIEHGNEFIWDEDKLKKLYQEY
jgi:hypothetical protein